MAVRLIVAPSRNLVARLLAWRAFCVVDSRGQHLSHQASPGEPAGPGLQRWGRGDCKGRGCSPSLLGGGVELPPRLVQKPLPLLCRPPHILASHGGPFRQCDAHVAVVCRCSHSFGPLQVRTRTLAVSTPVCPGASAGPGVSGLKQRRKHTQPAFPTASQGRRESPAESAGPRALANAGFGIAADLSQAVVAGVDPISHSRDVPYTRHTESSF